ncbi:hypothetical protein OY671_011501, partial [Metschnikowia pulcherrima]
YGSVGALAIASSVAAFTDIRRRQIDNWSNAAIASAAPAFWFAMGWHVWPDIAVQIGVASLTFAILAGSFALRVMGGGDVKSLAASASWIPGQSFSQLSVIMASTGGISTIVSGGWHVMRRQKDKSKIPYGVAIAAGGSWIIGTTNWAALQAVSAG